MPSKKSQFLMGALISGLISGSVAIAEPPSDANPHGVDSKAATGNEMPHKAKSKGTTKGKMKAQKKEKNGCQGKNGCGNMEEGSK